MLPIRLKAMVPWLLPLVEKLTGDSFAVIWTTTPWTLPASQAVSAGADIVYQLIATPKGNLVLAKDLARDALKRYGFLVGGTDDESLSDGLRVLAETTGAKVGKPAIEPSVF